jgi:GTP:adenosylcobinamide-phosphate guanylyltransferase
MITIGYSTRESNPKFQEYLKKTCGHPKVQVIEKVNNGEKSLSQTYNEIINESEHDIVVFCHDDIYFETSSWGRKLMKHFEESEYGILGVAGTTNIHESGRWWTDNTKMVGIVNHENEGKKWESRYANGIPNSIHQVCLVDGLFIAIYKNRIKHTFNESVPGFHFYDMTFCTENHLSGVQIGVIYNIRLTHKSIGMTNESWEKNREEYIERFKNELPISITPNINYNVIKPKQVKEKYNLIVQTSNNSENLVNFFERIKDLPVYDNLLISLISTDSNIEDVRKYESENVLIYEGFFETLNKNLSVLKWDDSFMNSKSDLLFFSTDAVTILNDVFSSMYGIFKNERSSFGCAFPSVLESDGTIFSNGLDIIQNKEEQFNLIFKNKSSYFNILHGHFPINFGSISDFFATTSSNLKMIDWFDINLETSIYNLDFALKSFLKKRKVYVDTNSVVMIDMASQFEKIDGELKQVLGQYMNAPEIRKNVKQIR